MDGFLSSILRSLQPRPDGCKDRLIDGELYRFFSNGDIERLSDGHPMNIDAAGKLIEIDEFPEFLNPLDADEISFQ